MLFITLREVSKWQYRKWNVRGTVFYLFWNPQCLVYSRCLINVYSIELCYSTTCPSLLSTLLPEELMSGKLVCKSHPEQTILMHLLLFLNPLILNEIFSEGHLPSFTILPGSALVLSDLMNFWNILPDKEPLPRLSRSHFLSLRKVLP